MRVSAGDPGPRTQTRVLALWGPEALVPTAQIEEVKQTVE